MTNKILMFPNEGAVREQAGCWIACLDRGLLPAERLELGDWIHASPRHREALFEMAGLWDRMDILGEISELFPLESRSTHRYYPLRPPVLLSIAVLVSTIVGVSLMSGEWGTQSISFIARMIGSRTQESTYLTAVGEQRAVTLPDHSVVTLNTATEMRVRYTMAERGIELLRGEAHFQVAKNERRVFRVRVADNEFSAIGTAFDIKVASENGIQLTVTEGRVQVRVPYGGVTGQLNRTAASEAGSTEIMVDAGKEVAIDRMIQTVELLQPAQLDAALAWRKGMMAFDAEPLEKALREVSRYSNTRFVIADEAAKRIPVSGYFKVGDVDGLIAALKNNFSINATREGDVIILSVSR